MKTLVTDEGAHATNPLPALDNPDIYVIHHVHYLAYLAIPQVEPPTVHFRHP
ncbi:hypothetical protein GCM10009800_53930 [Nocardiopsis rhodophaea]